VHVFEARHAAWPWWTEPLARSLAFAMLALERRSGSLVFRCCAVLFSRRRLIAACARRDSVGGCARYSLALATPAPHGQAPTPYLYKTPPKNIPDPKNSRVTDPKIPEVSAWRAMAGALRRGRSGPYALIFSGRGVRACPHEGPRDLLLLCSLKPSQTIPFSRRRSLWQR
jgi:hypothetical protein